MTVAEVKVRILSVFTKYGNTLLPGAFNQRLMEEYENAYTKMKKRNEKINQDYYPEAD